MVNKKRDVSHLQLSLGLRYPTRIDGVKGPKDVPEIVQEFRERVEEIVMNHSYGKAREINRRVTLKRAIRTMWEDIGPRFWPDDEDDDERFQWLVDPEYNDWDGYYTRNLYFSRDGETLFEDLSSMILQRCNRKSRNDEYRARRSNDNNVAFSVAEEDHPIWTERGTDEDSDFVGSMSDAPTPSRTLRSDEILLSSVPRAPVAQMVVVPVQNLEEDEYYAATPTATQASRPLDQLHGLPSVQPITPNGLQPIETESSFLPASFAYFEDQCNSPPAFADNNGQAADQESLGAHIDAALTVLGSPPECDDVPPHITDRQLALENETFSETATTPSASGSKRPRREVENGNTSSDIRSPLCRGRHWRAVKKQLKEIKDAKQRNFTDALEEGKRQAMEQERQIQELASARDIMRSQVLENLANLIQREKDEKIENRPELVKQRNGLAETARVIEGLQREMEDLRSTLRSAEDLNIA